jgi:hypothetical protein
LRAWRPVPRAPRAEAWRTAGTRPPREGVVSDHNWESVRRVMWDLVGIVRSDERLAFAARRLALLSDEIERDYDQLRLSPDLVELRNIALVGSLIVASAMRRRESRGLHYNLDHPRKGRELGPPARGAAPSDRPRKAACAGLRGAPIVAAASRRARMSQEMLFRDAVDELRERGDDTPARRMCSSWARWARPCARFPRSGSPIRSAATCRAGADRTA